MKTISSLLSRKGVVSHLFFESLIFFSYDNFTNSEFKFVNYKLCEIFFFNNAKNIDDF